MTRGAGSLKRKQVVMTPKRSLRSAKSTAINTIKRVDSMDSITGHLQQASLEDSPVLGKRGRSRDENFEIAMGDQSNSSEDEEVGDRRKSTRVHRPIVDPMYSSTNSTPGKRKMKRKRKSVVFKATKKAGKRTRPLSDKVVAMRLAKIQPLKVDGLALPGRESEFHQISSKLSTAIRSAQGLCLYLSGVPGTGKTATVREVIGNLQKSKAIPAFDYVEINGMRLSDPGQVYPLLWRHLGQEPNERLASSHLALKKLKSYFASSPRPVVVLLDELDALLQKKQSVLYHFFEWTGLESAKLIVVAIANTMDLPERLLSNRISSRMGLNRLNFTPYQYSQLQDIILHRLAPYKEWFHVDALEMCARKVSAVSGDARRAIAFATRAVDHIIADARRKGQSKPAPQSINLMVMRNILSSAFTGTPVFALKTASGLQLIMLESICHAWKLQLTHYDGSFYNVSSPIYVPLIHHVLDLQLILAKVQEQESRLRARHGDYQVHPVGLGRCRAH